MCACLCVYCRLSLTPNSPSLIGCVILCKDKEGHWNGSRGGGRETGQWGSLTHNCLACSFTRIQRDSHTFAAHRPCSPRYPPTILNVSPTLNPSTEGKKGKKKNLGLHLELWWDWTFKIRIKSTRVVVSRVICELNFRNCQSRCQPGARDFVWSDIHGAATTILKCMSKHFTAL